MEKSFIKQNSVCCVFSPVPLSSKGRVIIKKRPTGNESIIDYIERVGLKVPRNGCFVCRINGTNIPEEWWGRVYPKPCSSMTITASTRGPAAIPIVLAVLAASAPAIATAGLVAAGIAATTLTIAITATLITVGGSLLVGAIFSPKVPGASASISSRAGAEDPVSPTYSLSGGSNATRKYQPLPLVIGSHIIFPDFGSTPYVQFEGDNQYLYQIFEFGVADVNLVDIKIGTTVVTSFDEVETETASFATGAITLFPANTLSTNGSVLEPEDSTYITRTSAPDAVALRVELEGQITTLEKSTGEIISDAMDIVVQFRLGNSGPFLRFIEAGSFPQGTTQGAPLSAVRITSESRRKIRVSLYRSVAEGEYEVRIRRVPRKNDTSSLATRAMTWTQLLSHQKDTASYENRKRMAVRIKASGQITGALDIFSAVASTPIPVWNGSSEVTQESSNPGHQFIFFARGASNSDGRRRFGAILDDTRIDLTGLRTWATWCDTNNLKCDMVLDAATPAYEVLSVIARCGRATVAWNSGKLGVVYDEEGRAPIQAFGMFNIKKDSFAVNYLTENLANEVVVSYVDRDRDYQTNQVRVGVPGELLNDRSANVELMGVTTLSQAAEEANLMAASQFYRRKQITFDTDLENLVAVRGDVVTIAHDLTAWALSGRLISGTTTVLVVDRDVTVTADSFITIRKPDLTLTIHSITTSPGVTDTITISPALALAPDSDSDNKVKDYVWIYEDNTSPGKDFKITSIETNSDFSATISAVEEVAAYYESAAGDFTFVDNNLYNGEVASVSDIAFSETLVDNTGATLVTVSWVSIQSDSVTIEVSINSGTSSVTSGITSNSFDVLAKGGDTVTVKLRVSAIVTLRSSQLVISDSYIVEGLNQLPENVTGFSVSRNNDIATFRWNAVTDVDLDFYEIRKGSTWDTSVLINKAMTLTHQVLDPSAGSYLVKAVDFGSRQSQIASAVTIGSSVTTNVVFTDNEQDANWPGTFDDTAVNNDNELTLAGDSTWADLPDPWDTYQGTWQTTASFKLEGNYITDTFDIGASNDESTRVDADIVVSVLASGYTWATLSLPWTEYSGGWTWAGPEGTITVRIEIQTSSDDITYTSFSEFIPGAFNARYYKFRVTLTALDRNVLPVVEEFNVTYDVPDRVEAFEDQTVAAAGGSSFNFSRPFQTTPNIQVTLQSAAEGDTYLITTKNTTTVTIQIFDSAGVDIGGNADIHARGY